MLTLINTVERADPFDRPDWLFEAKFDGSPGWRRYRLWPIDLAQRLPVHRYEGMLDLQPKSHVFDGLLCSMTPAPSVQRTAVWALPSDLRRLRPADYRRRGSAAVGARKIDGSGSRQESTIHSLRQERLTTTVAWPPGALAPDRDTAGRDACGAKPAGVAG
jgi:hypothetical protein